VVGEQELSEETGWRIELLGGLRLWHNGKELKAFQHRKAGALLAYLAYYKDQSHDRDTLIGMLWPAARLDAGRNSLNVALSRIRQRLEGKQLLLTERQQLRLATSYLTTDVGDFESALLRARRLPTSEPRYYQQLEQALSAYSGSLLPSFDEDWVLGERQRLQDAYLGALEQRAQLQMAQGHWSEAIATSHHVLHHDPLRETAHQLLLTSYRSSGQVVAAQNHYQKLERLHLKELGRPLAEATRSLLLPTEPPPHPSSLPLELTHFFGRESERQELAYLRVCGSRLITLMGPGGIGKTRLALELARSAEERGERVYWLPLADTPAESRLWEALLGQLQRLGKSAPPQLITAQADQAQEEVIALLQQEPCLLVLDNLEHLRETCLHPFLQTLLRRVRTVSLLATSRRRLAFRGEQVYVVEPLPLPESAPQAAWASPSLQLLQDRVSLLRPGFSLTQYSLEPLRALCTRLDGLPLALEMAAARLATLSPETVLQRLTENVEVLVSAHRDVHPRHLSLKATFLWSYQLLSDDARWFLQTLSVFRGGCTLEAAEAIGGKANLLEPLTELLDASLLQCESHPARTRYTLLESLRQLVHSLLEDDERDTLRQRHALYFSQVNAKEEYENCALALTWLQGSSYHLPAELQLAESLFFYWMRQGTLQFNFTKVERSLERLLAQEHIASIYANFLIEVTLHYARTSNFTKAFGLIDLIDQKCDYNYLFIESKAKAFAFLGNIDKALNYYTEFLKDTSILPSQYILASINMSSLYTRIDQNEKALDILQEVQKKNDKSEKNTRLEAIILCSLSIVQGRLQQTALGKINYHKAIALFDSLGDHHSIMRIGWYEAELARLEGQWDLSYALYRQSVEHCHALAETDLLIEGLIGLIYCHLHYGNHLRALLLLGGIQAIIAATGCLRTHNEQVELDTLASELRAAFSGNAQETLALGRALRPEQVVKLAQEPN
jgi:predicted ATPase/DNA-binding SARP family transcriptional activator